jgi:hypothetical protein
MANREQEILSITERRVAQGLDAAEQYAILNKARDKRNRRRERNRKNMLGGGCANIILLDRRIVIP